MWILAFLGMCNAVVEKLKANDLLTLSTYLVYLYYEKPGFKCPACELYLPVLDKLNLPVKTHNFSDDVKLGSKFLQYKFPSFIFRKNGCSFILNPKTPEDLVDIINNRKTSQMQPVRPFLDVNSTFIRIFSSINPFIFKVIDIAYFLMDYTPRYVVSAFFIFVIVYLIYSIVEIIMDNEQKPKED